jgi:hypothetical protein
MPDNTRRPPGRPGGLELRPWRAADAAALVTASHDPAIGHWHLLPAPTEDEAGTRIGRMRKRRQSETDTGLTVLTTRRLGPRKAGFPLEGSTRHVPHARVPGDDDQEDQGNERP